MDTGNEIDNLVMELGTMSIKDIQEYREEVMKDLTSFKRPKLAIIFINTLIDLIIQKKQEKARAAI
ncbi:hypothetical protein [Hungatella hathewayi]|uniref:hypothetical protein n=1 Tax=Hungatella hathewayi TaxID=154046 RepID=UPI0018A0BB07|nr:hypothetical protein [Hungatella hathewayi]